MRISTWPLAALILACTTCGSAFPPAVYAATFSGSAQATLGYAYNMNGPPSIFGIGPIGCFTTNNSGCDETQYGSGFLFDPNFPNDVSTYGTVAYQSTPGQLGALLTLGYIPVTTPPPFALTGEAHAGVSDSLLLAAPSFLIGQPVSLLLNIAIDSKTVLDPFGSDTNVNFSFAMTSSQGSAQLVGLNSTPIAGGGTRQARTYILNALLGDTLSLSASLDLFMTETFNCCQSDLTERSLDYSNTVYFGGLRSASTQAPSNVVGTSGYNYGTVIPPPTAVPGPATFPLLLSALGGVMCIGRRAALSRR